MLCGSDPYQTAGVGRWMFLNRKLYLYAQDDPVDGIDPSGNDDIGEMLATIDISVSLDSLAGIVLNFLQGPIGTPGPNITVALNNTMKEVEQVYNSPNTSESVRKAAADNLIYHPWAEWDIFKLERLGQGDVTGYDFGPGSYFGTGDGEYTVQFGTPPKVYYAGSVNYILWGKMFYLINHHGYRPWLYSESEALLGVTIEKIKNNVLKHQAGPFSIYADEARAFTDYGYFGANPSFTALTGFKPNPSNVAAPAALGWHWGPIH